MKVHHGIINFPPHARRTLIPLMTKLTDWGVIVVMGDVGINTIFTIQNFTLQNAVDLFELNRDIDWEFKSRLDLTTIQVKNKELSTYNRKPIDE